MSSLFPALLLWAIAPLPLTENLLIPLISEFSSSAGSKEIELSPPTAPVSSNSNSSHSVNLDGVIFETLIPQREWVVPANEPGAYTPLDIRLRVTNTTQEQIRLSLPMGIFPSLIGSDDSVGSTVASGLSSRTIGIDDYPLVPPGESIVLHLDGRLFWSREGGLIASGHDDYAHEWFSGGLQPNTSYCLWITYFAHTPAERPIPRGWLNPPEPRQRISQTVRVFQEEATSDSTPVELTVEGIVANRVETLPVQIRLVSQ